MSTFRAYLVERGHDDRLAGSVQPVPTRRLPAAGVEVRVCFSSVNYKDALSAEGHPGVTRSYPHIPGIDATGIVTRSDAPQFRPGDRVIVTGFGFGMNHWGGFAEIARVPAAWVVPLPNGLSMWEAMALGTAGLTVALGIEMSIQNGLKPHCGPVLVTGASGGVGSLAVALFAHLGYHVIAATGKADSKDYLRALGAREVLPRNALLAETRKPLGSADFAGAFDTVGGDLLAHVLRSMRYRGVVAACGLAGGHDLSTTVYPFILRAVRLLGIDSAEAPLGHRVRLWRRLAGLWKPDHLSGIAHDIPLASVAHALSEIRSGNARGRCVVAIAPP
ncbi:MAG: YhdH/YhfP family quinone oxidoreductase [Acidiferrobacteraceae bacterium]